MPNGAPGGERQPVWRNRKIIAAGAGVAAAAVVAVVVALAATGNGAPQPKPRAAPPATASTAPQGQPSAASSALASPPQAQPPATQSAPATASGGTHTALVTRAELGPDWPLTVPSGWVRCVARSNAYTFRTTGRGARTYALNLAALKLGYPSITAIQIQSQDGTGEPADVSPLQERAANVC